LLSNLAVFDCIQTQPHFRCFPLERNILRQGLSRFNEPINLFFSTLA
jgi:hypothetical protein